MSHPTNTDILERQYEDIGFWRMRLDQAKEQGNWAGVDLARKKINQIINAGHKIEGYTHYEPNHIN